ncbi:hypothetical protein [Streptomyces candidus]|uniref:Uncharacterized protein n=1 Tax=Streptomyces candidus TaxID=67283 RepID=A0A7X0LPL0_9ACTN|nr:hypothetical protein [Streptomyces candidus]MBB6436095.1 hypothetical protein [Streptomyces candidus]
MSATTEVRITERVVRAADRTAGPTDEGAARRHRRVRLAGPAPDVRGPLPDPVEITGETVTIVVVQIGRTG